jgi:hypothetical protein
VKKIEEQRLPFSDYPAEEQERDAKRAKRLKLIRHAYLMRIDGEWAHFIIGQGGEDIDYYEDMKLPQVVKKLERSKPEYTPKVIMNEGLENYLRDRRPEFKKRRGRQLTINFEKEKRYGY